MKLLAAGYSHSDVANTVEVEEELIDELADEYCQQIEDIRNGDRTIGVTTAISTISEDNDDRFERADINGKMDIFETEMLGKLRTRAGMETNTMSLLRIFQTVNAAKRRGSDKAQDGTITVNNVQIVHLAGLEDLQKLVPKYTTDHNRQITAINGRELAIAGADTVKELAGLMESEDDNTTLQLETRAEKTAN